MAASATVSAGVGVYPFQRNCFHCTQSHRQCKSDNRCQSQCSLCTKRGLPILYKLSSQGQRNDLKAWKSPDVASATNAVVDAAAFPMVASVLPKAAVMGDAGKFPAVASTVASEADPVADAVTFPAVAVAISMAAVMGDAGKISAMASTVASVADAMTWEDDSTVGDGGDVDDDACSTDSFSGFVDPGGRFAITNESVHYHHRSGSHLLSDGDSCHGCVEQVKLNGNLSQSVSVSVSSIIPPWVHAFATCQCRRLSPGSSSLGNLHAPLRI